MEKKKQVAEFGAPNVINLKMDATFFFERAVQSLDRFHYDKALKYFRRAAEYEPDNPVNHCNLAGIYSELGNYEESNRILQEVLEKIDPGMTECYFYMANNYANMERFEQSEQALIQYLELDPNGQFLEEAEEMMDMLGMELNRPTRLRNIKSREDLFEHDQARRMLEEGRFAEATKRLEKLVKQKPNFLAARNNLALAYYYMGEFKQCLATIHEVLNLDSGNLHALCNLAIVFHHARQRKELASLAKTLGKLYPYHADHVYKLATTLGILGEHDGAYRQFKRLLRTGISYEDPGVLHYAAVAAFNLGRYEEARRLWMSLDKFDPETGIARFYLKEWEKLKRRNPQIPLAYQYNLPYEEKFRHFDKKLSAIPEAVKRDPLVRSSFMWALHHGDTSAKQHVIQALGMIADNEAEETLRRFLLEPGEDDYLKRVAAFVLRTIGAKDPIRAILGGRETTIAPHAPISSGLSVWEPKWQTVLNQALRQMERRYDMIQQHDMQTLWVEYLSKVYPATPRIVKTEGWAAALEYLTAKMHSRAVTIKEVAERYEVSQATIGKNVRMIDEACGLWDKMNAIFKPYLT